MLPALLSLTFGFARQIFLMIGAVTNLNSFPHPLKPEEEREYFEKYKEGSEEARNILIEHNLRLVAHIVKKYGMAGRENDDLISIGTIGLIKAISTYDITKGTRFATYAARCIENEILMQMRATKKLQSEVSLNDPIGTDKEGNEITLNDIIGSGTDSVIDEVELKIQVRKLYRKMKAVLQNREKRVLEMRYGLQNGFSRTQREVAKILGISRSYVSRIEKKAIKKLGKELKIESCN